MTWLQRHFGGLSEICPHVQITAAAVVIDVNLRALPARITSSKNECSAAAAVAEGSTTERYPTSERSRRSRRQHHGHVVEAIKQSSNQFLHELPVEDFAAIRFLGRQNSAYHGYTGQRNGSNHASSYANHSPMLPLQLRDRLHTPTLLPPFTTRTEGPSPCAALLFS